MTISVPQSLNLAFELAPAIDADKELVSIMDTGSASDKISRTSWAFVLARLGTTFKPEQLERFPVPGTFKRPNGDICTGTDDDFTVIFPSGSNAPNAIPDKWERSVATADGTKKETGSFYRSLFLATERGKQLIAEQNNLDKTVPDARERKASKTDIDDTIRYHVRLLRRAMHVQQQMWRINDAAPDVDMRWLKTKEGKISTASRNIEIFQARGNAELIGKGDVLSYSSFLKLDTVKALAKRGNVPAGVTVLDLLETNTRGADEEETTNNAAINYPPISGLHAFESFLATGANYAEKLQEGDATKALWTKVNSAGSDDFLLSMDKVFGMLQPVMTNPAVRKRLNALHDAEAPKQNVA